MQEMAPTIYRPFSRSFAGVQAKAAHSWQSWLSDYVIKLRDLSDRNFEKLLRSQSY